MKQLSNKFDVMATHNRMLETQISQVAQQQAAIEGPAGAFPSQPQPNPKGYANSNTLRSGTELDEPTDPRIQNPAMYQNSGKGSEKVNEPTKDRKKDKSREAIDKEPPYVPPPPYKPHVPYPQRLAKSKNEGQFKKFVELLKQLNITMPFTKAITQMYSYDKFLKEILSKKKKLEDDETIMLTAECSAIIQNNMPHKLKDPDSFSIPYIIGKFIIYKALGMLENIPVRIGQFYILTDFVIMDIKEDSHIPIILGRPFLATVGAIIDVKKGSLTFEVREEKVKFLLAKFLQAPAIDDSCCLLDVIDKCVKEMEKEPFKYTEVLKIPTHPIFEDDNRHEPYVDDSLRECLALTPNLIPCLEKPLLELKTLPKDLRYEFLDTELERPVIVNADLRQIESEKITPCHKKVSNSSRL
ncbi:uncharacterized protein LOC127130083 [Lathyrus oleraceus]|uniref:uncharacterized protein LOC127130083 n=1 Tax=Pisum sativum TaxID=3888 RepID=UPI0021D07987|nr:uncharacterized protein LOC127130083 [Pisum sativum]